MYTETDDVIGTVTLYIYISSSFRVSLFRPFVFLPVVISLLFRYIIYIPMNFIAFWPGVFFLFFCIFLLLIFFLLQEVFHVYLNKFENAVTHLFLVILGNN